MALLETQSINEPVPFELNSLDPSDPIDKLLIEYQNAAMSDRLPTAAQEELLVTGIKQGSELAARQLVRSHKSLVAAVAHPYKQQRSESVDLLITGAKGLLQAARTYVKGSELEFSDHAVMSIEAALNSSSLEIVPVYHDATESRPMERIFKYMATIQNAREREAEHQSALSGFSKLQQKVLPLLVMSTHEQIADAIPAPLDSVNTAISRCLTKTGTKSSTALALHLHQKGLKYNIPAIDKPLVDLLTDEDLVIGNNLGLQYEEIAKMIDDNYTYDDIRWRVDSMKRKTGTSTRVELALLVKTYDTGERHSAETVLAKRLRLLSAKLGVTVLEHAETELLLEKIPASQAEVIRPYYLSGQSNSWSDVGEQLNISPVAARVRAGRGIKKLSSLLANA